MVAHLSDILFQPDRPQALADTGPMPAGKGLPHSPEFVKDAMGLVSYGVCISLTEVIYGIF